MMPKKPSKLNRAIDNALHTPETSPPERRSKEELAECLVTFFDELAKNLQSGRGNETE